MARVAAWASVRPPPGAPRRWTRSPLDLVVLGPAAEIAGGDLAQLADGVVRRGVVGPGHRVDGLAAVRRAGPRHVLAGVAPHHLDLLPRHAEDFGRHARDVDHGMGAEVAGARLHDQAPVGADGEQPVVVDRVAADERAHRHADAARRGAALLPAALLPLGPVEELGALVERLADEGAGDVAALALLAGRADRRLARRRVDLVQFHGVELELARGLGQHRLEDGVLLHPAGRTLRRARRVVGQHRQAAEAHRQRLVGERADARRRDEVVLVLVGPGVLDDEQVDGGDAAVLAQSDLHPAEQVGPCPADVVLLLARDPHHHRQSELLRQQRRDRHRVRRRESCCRSRRRCTR